MIWVMSSLLKETLSITLSVYSERDCSVLEFLLRKHGVAMHLLKGSAFSKKFETISPLKSSGGIEEILI